MPPARLPQLTLKTLPSLAIAAAPLRPSLPKSKSHQLRAMASAAAAKAHWLVIVPDQPGKLEARMAVRSDHLKNVTPKVDEGFWKVGGALLDEQPKEGEALKINGSCFIAHAATKDEVLVELKNDVYAKGEVWDFEKKVVRIKGQDDGGGLVGSFIPQVDNTLDQFETT
ncbi:hypothetical protein V490_04450 [Pseudogymnoascus sp. VKM F-3557]|nr:hypothetical protein V490_04450 [Pseudogymnoascus sp. VKM F-3557]